MKLFDAHCHLLSKSDMAAATAAGVCGFVLNATRESDWTAVADMIAAHGDVYGTVGIHPWYVDKAADGWNMRLGDMLRAHPRLMVGETGLDKNRGDIGVQAKFLSEHLRIAAHFGRAVHIHCVGAWGVLLETLRDAPRVPAIVMHAYCGSPDMMRELMRYNAYFSFGGGVMNPRHKNICASATVAPCDKILVESDAPDSGVQSADLANVVAHIAALRGVEIAQMSDIIYKNTIGIVNK